MKNITIGIIREGKTPPDFRVPLTPKQCKLIETKFPNVSVKVQTSPIRFFKDDEYRAEGIEIVEKLDECDIIFGVKEVKIQDLIPNKKFFFFSHTIKKQAYNRDLLRAVLEKNIELIDYEVIKDTKGKRLIGFGRYAGIVGCYNGFRTFGLKQELYSLKKAVECNNRLELEEELKKVILPKNTKIVITGFGRVGYGAREILDLLPIMEIGPDEFLTKDFNQPVYTHLDVEDYFERCDGNEFDRKDFYTSGKENHRSVFKKFMDISDMYIACHYWSDKSPLIFTNKDVINSTKRLKVVADVSCDINLPIASTLQSSTIENPIYGYNPDNHSIDDYMKDGNIAVMAVDNLPCELPGDASEDFGSELIKNVLPALFIDDFENIISNATISKEGKLTERFIYLQDYVD